MEAAATLALTLLAAASQAQDAPDIRLRLIDAVGGEPAAGVVLCI